MELHTRPSVDVVQVKLVRVTIRQNPTRPSFFVQRVGFFLYLGLTSPGYTASRCYGVTMLTQLAIAQRHSGLNSGFEDEVFHHSSDTWSR